jgi:hypothetical protein
MKLKVDKNKMVGLTGVKRPTFDRLISQMEKHADAIIGLSPFLTSFLFLVFNFSGEKGRILLC